MTFLEKSFSTIGSLRTGLVILCVLHAPLDTFAAEKAVLEASEAQGIRLSAIARKTIEVATLPVSSEPPRFVPETSLVYYLDRVGVYRLRDQWFKLIEVRAVKRDSKQWSIQTTELKPGDEIVIKGAALLRVAEMEAFSGGE